MPVAPNQPVLPRHFPEDRVDSELLAVWKRGDQIAQLMAIPLPFRRRSSTAALRDLRTRRKIVSPSQRRPQSDPAYGGARDEIRRRAHILLSVAHSKGGRSDDQTIWCTFMRPHFALAAGFNRAARSQHRLTIAGSARVDTGYAFSAAMPLSTSTACGIT